MTVLELWTFAALICLVFGEWVVVRNLERWHLDEGAGPWSYFFMVFLMWLAGAIAIGHS